MLSGEIKVFAISFVSKKKVGLSIRQINNLVYSGELKIQGGLKVYQQYGNWGIRCATASDIDVFQKSRSSTPDYITAQEKFKISKDFFYRNKEKVLPFINNNCDECLYHAFGCHPWEGRGCKFTRI